MRSTSIARCNREHVAKTKASRVSLHAFAFKARLKYLTCKGPLTGCRVRGRPKPFRTRDRSRHRPVPGAVVPDPHRRPQFTTPPVPRPGAAGVRCGLGGARSQTAAGNSLSAVCQAPRLPFRTMLCSSRAALGLPQLLQTAATPSPTPRASTAASACRKQNLRSTPQHRWGVAEHDRTAPKPFQARDRPRHRTVPSAVVPDQHRRPQFTTPPVPRGPGPRACWAGWIGGGGSQTAAGNCLSAVCQAPRHPFRTMLCSSRAVLILPQPLQTAATPSPTPRASTATSACRKQNLRPTPQHRWEVAGHDRTATTPFQARDRSRHRPVSSAVVPDQHRRPQFTTPPVPRGPGPRACWAGWIGGGVANRGRQLTQYRLPSTPTTLFTMLCSSRAALGLPQPLQTAATPSPTPRASTAATACRKQNPQSTPQHRWGVAGHDRTAPKPFQARDRSRHRPVPSAVVPDQHRRPQFTTPPVPGPGAASVLGGMDRGGGVANRGRQLSQYRLPSTPPPILHHALLEPGSARPASTSADCSHPKPHAASEHRSHRLPQAKLTVYTPAPMGGCGARSNRAEAIPSPRPITPSTRSERGRSRSAPPPAVHHTTGARARGRERVGRDG